MSLDSLSRILLKTFFAEKLFVRILFLKHMQFKIFHSDLIFTSDKSLSKSFLIVSIVPSLAEMLVYDGLYLNVKIYGFKQFQSKKNFSSIIIDV